MSRTAAIRIQTPQYEADLPRFRPVGENAPARLRHADDGDRPSANPPAELQRDLALALAQGAFDARIDAELAGKKWSARRTIAFAVLTCSAFWGGFAYLVFKLF